MMVELEVDNQIIVSDSLRQQLKLPLLNHQENNLPIIRYEQRMVKLPWKAESKAIQVYFLLKSSELADPKSLHPIIADYFSKLLDEDKLTSRIIDFSSHDESEDKRISSNLHSHPHIKSRYPCYGDFESRISKVEMKRWLLLYLSTHESNDL